MTLPSRIFKRKIYGSLLKWKSESNGSSALLIQGARRIGKSTIAEEFAKNEYESYLLIDFNNPGPNLIHYFENYQTDLDRLFFLLQTEYGVNLTRRKSLVIFDEIQLFPLARKMIKYLVADGRYDYIETGSLISIMNSMKGFTIPSEEEDLCMYPMDFEEFCWACDMEFIPQEIRKHYANRTPLGRDVHDTLMNKFREYMLIGGMPQSVATFIETNDLNEVERTKSLIISLYRKDITRESALSGRAAEIFDHVPSFLSDSRKLFRPGKIAKGTRMEDYSRSILWLSDAMICNVCYNVNDPDVSLDLTLDRNTFKCYLSDTGLLITLSFSRDILSKKEFFASFTRGSISMNEGMIFENAVAQALKAGGHELRYCEFYNKGSTHIHEIDFLLPCGAEKMCPIEVKSGKISDRHISLDRFCEKYRDRIAGPIVIHTKDLREEKGILYIPIYMAWLL